MQCPTALHILRLFRLPASLTTSNRLGSNPDQADVNDAQVPVFAWFGSDRPLGRRGHVRDAAADERRVRPSGPCILTWARWDRLSATEIGAS